MSIFDAFRKKPAAPGDEFNKEADKINAKIEKRNAEREKRQIQIEDCVAVLNECRLNFEKSILSENALAAETRRMGYEPVKQRERVREAAIGIMITELAKLELKSINSEADLNSAMNKMGMALRQLKRLDSKTAAISPRTERIVEQWYPGAFTKQAQAEDAAALPFMEVPEEMRAKIDDIFVEDLMAGDPYVVAMYNRSNRRDIPSAPAAAERPRSNADAILNQTRAAVNQDPSSEVDASEVLKQYNMNKF